MILEPTIVSNEPRANLTPFILYCQYFCIVSPEFPEQKQHIRPGFRVSQHNMSKPRIQETG